MQKVNLMEKFKLFDEHWTPKLIGELNKSYVKLATFKGEFVWHKHDKEDLLSNIPDTNFQSLMIESQRNFY